MSAILGKKHVQEYVYDFAEDGGTDDTFIDLSAKAGYAPLPATAVVTDVGLYVLTTVSGSSSTIDVGNTTDPNGFMAAIAEGSLTAGAAIRAGEQAGALLWDDTNDHMIAFPVSAGDADDADFGITIGTADLTAGKIVFWVEYYLPKTEA